MCELKPVKAAPDVPGLAYFVAQAPKPVKTDVAQPRPEVAVLEQMFGYFAA